MKPWHRTPATPSRPDTEHNGTIAHREAQQNLDAVRARWPEVKNVVDSLREVRMENHLRERLELLFYGGAQK